MPGREAVRDEAAGDQIAKDFVCERNGILSEGDGSH